MNEDTLEIQILPDGRIKTISPGSISAQNHSNAEAFFRFISTMTDGSNVRGKLKQAHSHHHQHEEEKENQ